jgi:hypothetical protein
MPTVEFRVRACDARLKASFTIAIFELAAEDDGCSLRMEAAFL